MCRICRVPASAVMLDVSWAPCGIIGQQVNKNAFKVVKRYGTTENWKKV